MINIVIINNVMHGIIYVQSQIIMVVYRNRIVVQIINQKINVHLLLMINTVIGIIVYQNV